MTIAALIPLLFLLLIIIAFAALSKVHISPGKVRLAAGLYMAVLFASVPVYYAIAEPGTQEPAKIIDIEQGQYSYQELQINEFYTAVAEGWLSEYQDAEIIARWNFDYQQKHLKITDNDRYYSLIAVERKAVNDGKLEVLIYAPKSANRLTPANLPDIRLRGNQLEIIKPGDIDLQESRFSHDFTMAQFTGMGMGFERPIPIFIYETILYLRIPENLQIDTEESMEHIIHFFDE